MEASLSKKAIGKMKRAKLRLEAGCKSWLSKTQIISYHIYPYPPHQLLGCEMKLTDLRTPPKGSACYVSPMYTAENLWVCFSTMNGELCLRHSQKPAGFNIGCDPIMQKVPIKPSQILLLFFLKLLGEWFATMILLRS